MSKLLGSSPSAGWRFPRRDGAKSPPRTAAWRCNLVALSHDFNLYFAVYGDELHITIPRDLRQTLPAAPDVIIDLPRTKKAYEVPGCLDRVHAHDVNNVKVGALGDHEILLMGCDDGDVIAYYTHQLAREAAKAGHTRGRVPVKPFFHENVGISAWGLAIHQGSRLIATGTNFREVIVFKPGIARVIDPNAKRRCNDDHDIYTLVDPLKRTTQLYTPVSTLTFGEPDGGVGDLYRQMSVRLRLPLGSRGHNVPSIDFLSDDRGEASTVVAVDINGKLWSLDLATAEALESPPIEVPQIEPWNSDEDEIECRGWGVVCVSADAFKLVRTPQEALGVPKMTDAFKVRTDSRNKRYQSLEITSSVTDVRENSSIHPPLPSALLRSSPASETLDDMLELESDESPSISKADDLMFGQKKLFVLSLLKDYKTSNKYTLSRPANVPHLTDRNWVERMIQILESESWCQDARIRKWVEETEGLANEQWDRGTTIRSDMEALQFFFKLPTQVRHQFSSWNEIVTALPIQTVPEQPPAAVLLPGSTDSLRLMRAQDGMTAIIRMNSYDIELLPPNPEALSTICRGFAQQRLRSAHAEAFLDNYDQHVSRDRRTITPSRGFAKRASRPLHADSARRLLVEGNRPDLDVPPRPDPAALYPRRGLSADETVAGCGRGAAAREGSVRCGPEEDLALGTALHGSLGVVL
ncbi:pyridine nucleotide-disulfide oxidoreductase family protein [Diplocarpon rosae]|nr:pyridine nucleotide-disulfide oxidoreductase family protein [Diplocarpon rosae]